MSGYFSLLRTNQGGTAHKMYAANDPMDKPFLGEKLHCAPNVRSWEWVGVAVRGCALA